VASSSCTFAFNSSIYSPFSFNTGPCSEFTCSR
jgi:hypothetical protein